MFDIAAESYGKFVVSCCVHGLVIMREDIFMSVTSFNPIHEESSV